MILFNSEEEKKEKKDKKEGESSNPKDKRHWLERDYPTVFTEVNTRVKSMPQNANVSYMISNIERVSKEITNTHTEPIYYQILASLYVVIYKKRNNSPYLAMTDFDEKKKAVFSFVTNIARDIDYKKSTLATLVIRMCVDFLERYKNLISDYDKRNYPDDPKNRVAKMIMKTIVDKQNLIITAQKIEKELEKKVEYLK